MANEQEAATAREMTLPVQISGRTATHTFGVLLRGLSSEILIGIDLQAKLHLGTPVPPRSVLRTRMRCYTTGSLVGKTSAED